MARMNWDRVQREDRLMRWLRSGDRSSDEAPGDIVPTPTEPRRPSVQQPSTAPIGRFTALLKRGKTDLSPVGMASWSELHTQLADVVCRLQDGDGLLLAGTRSTQEVLLYRRGRDIRVRVFSCPDFRVHYLRCGMAFVLGTRFGDVPNLEKTFERGQAVTASRHIVAIIQNAWGISEPDELRYLKVLELPTQSCESFHK